MEYQEWEDLLTSDDEISEQMILDKIKKLVDSIYGFEGEGGCDE